MELSMESIWHNTAKMPQFATLDGCAKTSVLVIGGGLCGLLCAYRLAEAGVSVALAEADQLCAGTTQNTTAKITAQHGLLYAALIGRIGIEGARRYLAANERALADYRTLCTGALSIDCAFTTCDSFIYLRRDRVPLERELEALEKIGANADFVEPNRLTDLPFSTVGAVRFPGQAYFHPLRFAAGIADLLAGRGAAIYTHTPVRTLRREGGGWLAQTDGGSIRAEAVIVATHFPFLRWRGGYYAKMYQSRSYVLALKNVSPVKGMFLDAEEGGLSLRDAEDCLLFGGGGARTGKPCGGWSALEEAAQRCYPGASVAASWAAEDCMTLDGMPYIGRLSSSSSTAGLYTATGFGKWGMTSAMMAARLLTGLVIGRPEPDALLFSPSRSLLHPQLAVNLLEASKNLLTVSASRPRCPHLGCTMRYNKAEHSWDCPCHGSRFTAQGRLLEGPAARGLRRHR